MSCRRLGFISVRTTPRLRAFAIGLSTHDIEQIERAAASRPAYVAFGPVFQTQSKEAPDPVTGTALLANACESARRHQVPLVAIGGLDADRARTLDPAVSAIAVIGALIHPDLEDVRRAAQALSGAFRERCVDG